MSTATLARRARQRAGTGRHCGDPGAGRPAAGARPRAGADQAAVAEDPVVVVRPLNRAAGPRCRGPRCAERAPPAAMRSGSDESADKAVVTLSGSSTVNDAAAGSPSGVDRFGIFEIVGGPR